MDYPNAGLWAAVLGWLRRFWWRLAERLGLRNPEAQKPRVLPDLLHQLRPIVYEAKPSGRVEIAAMRLAHHGSAAMLMRVECSGALNPGSRYRFEVQQHFSSARLKKEWMGGSTFEVVIAGEAEVASPEDDPDGEVEPRPSPDEHDDPNDRVQPRGMIRPAS
jgi:hypothetical protein